MDFCVYLLSPSAGGCGLKLHQSLRECREHRHPPQEGVD